MKTDWSLILQEGAIISLIVIIIIFLVGFILYKFFARKFLMMILNLRQKLHIQGKPGSNTGDDAIPPEHTAAIAMAIYLYDKVHDEESTILTIERKSRYYSPWSSKYYNMRKPIHYYRK
jgi:hypothetical protein